MIRITLVPKLHLLLIKALATFSLWASLAAAETVPLSQHWHTHLWVHDHSDVEVNVYHLPNGTIRGVGRFSNGLQTIDRKFDLGIFVENTDGEVWHMVINELVPPTGPGGTQVKWKTAEMMIRGEVQKVYARAVILNNQSGTFSIKIECDYGQQGTHCELPKPSHEAESLGQFGGYGVATKQSPVNICAGFDPQSWHTTEVGYWKQCDPSTGAITELSKVLDRPIPVCPTCPIK